MANITSAGIGSGLDIESLVSQLIAAERQPVQNRLDRREAQLQAKLSAYGAFKGALSAFQSTLSGMSSADKFQSVSVESSDRDVFTASASSEAAAASYSIDVSNLAAAHSLASGAFSSKTDAIGSDPSATGTLTFRFGTTDYDPGGDTYSGFVQNADKPVQTVTIDSGNNSLEGIRDAVNSADIGVSASIVNDGSGYRLVFVSTDTGAANSLEVSVDEGSGGDNADATGLSQLAFNSAVTSMTQTRAAQDAALTVNGLAVSSDTNSLTDTIEGVTINLAKAGSATLTVDQDRSGATKAVDAFVSAYNKLIDTVTGLTNYDAENRRAATLTGDSTVRNVMYRVRSLIGSPVEGLPDAYGSLAAIGITTDSLTGKLQKDDAALSEALQENFAGIGRLFAVTAQASDALVGYTSATSDTKAGEYALNVTRLATRGALTGGAVSVPITITGGNNDTFTIKVDGVQSGTITLSAGSYSAEEMAAEVQARINGDANLQDSGVAVGVSFDTDRFVITSARFGSASKVANTSGSAASALALATGTAADGVDAAGTIGGQAAVGSGRYLTGAGDAKGLKVEVSGGGTGDRGTVSFTRGYADQINAVLTGLLGTDSVIGARTDGIQTRIEDIGDEREQLSRRIATLQERYRAQFTALDTLVSQLQTTSSFLTQQLESLPGAYRPDRRS